VSERFLANENFPAEAVAWLRELGHDVLHAAEMLRGAPDDEVIRVARSESRIVLTLDRDFGELVFHQRTPAHGIVLFRVGRQPPAILLSVLRAFFESGPQLTGYFTVATPGSFRQAPLPGDA